MIQEIAGIRQLIYTGDYDNIVLAFELIQSLNIDPQEALAPYRLLMGLEDDEVLSINTLYDAQFWLFVQLHKKEIEELPQEIGYFKYLNHLSVSGLCQELPISLLELKELQSIELKRHKFTEIPNLLYKMPQLESLTLSSGPIQHLSPQLAQLPKLRSLSLSDSRLSFIPEEIFETCTQLELLQLDNNLLQQLPESLCKLKKLKTLYLNDNPSLSALPQNIGHLQQLNFIDLSGNSSLKNLPLSFAALKNLATCFLGRTNKSLTSFPLLSQMPWTEFLT